MLLLMALLTTLTVGAPPAVLPGRRLVGVTYPAGAASCVGRELVWLLETASARASCVVLARSRPAAMSRPAAGRQHGRAFHGSAPGQFRRRR
jgi:hypothetical protein